MAYALYLAASSQHSDVTVTGNTLDASGSTPANSYHTDMASNYTGPYITITPGSVGNVIDSRTCATSGWIDGAIAYTNGTTCP